MSILMDDFFKPVWPFKIQIPKFASLFYFFLVCVCYKLLLLASVSLCARSRGCQFWLHDTIIWRAKKNADPWAPPECGVWPWRPDFQKFLR